MFRLEWKDGVLSEDMYNLTRAKDILKNYGEYRKNMVQRKNSLASPPSSPLGAFKYIQGTWVATWLK